MVLLSQLWKNLAGWCRVVPYTSSAALQWRSFLSGMRTPNNTIGSEFVHLSGIDWHFRATCNWRWKRDTKQFAMEWQAVVRVCLVPSNCTNCCQWWDWNCPPQSVVMTDGTPIVKSIWRQGCYQLTQPWYMLSELLPASVWNGPHISISMWNHLMVVMVPQYPDGYDQTECQV